ncbi:4'-phosphopantetheinyl transferase family protein [Paenibacillus turpanensis]|uniref:4'-phosphopantetheinyl transferase family protein n=1 Tax=Paenibacillus turpanensis TaxID=2689078 RepID=UPI001FB770D9|nr:4'-phosphopantetheinyl transferase superfamily protein [Paenibacillus turpanensis]
MNMKNTYAQPEVPPLLDVSECHIWWARWSDLQPWHGQLLNEEEQGRAQAYRRLEDRARFMVGCAISRLVLAAELGCPPQQVPLDRTCPGCGKAHGRPRLPRSMPQQLSVSHSGELVAVAFTTGTPVGIDVEQIQTGAEISKLIQGVLSDAEAAKLSEMPMVERREGFYTFWTRKEAVLKATGKGLAIPPENLSVSGPNEPARLVSSSGAIQEQLAAGAMLTDLHPGPGYTAALALLDSAPKRIREFDAALLLKGN